MNYAAGVLNLFRETHHAGSLPGEHRGRATGRGSGPEVVFGAAVRAGRIEAMRFGALGCPHVIAACEWVCREAEGRDCGWLFGVTAGDLAAAVAAPAEKTGSMLVIEDALRALAESLDGGAAAARGLDESTGT